MKNYVQDGDILDLALPYDRKSGEGLKVGDIFAVATIDGLNGVTIPGKTTGVFDLKYGVNAAVAAVGTKIYWDDATKNVTSTAGGNLLIGVNLVAALANDATMRVKLIPAA